MLFASLFKILPDADVAWGDVWIGAAVTSLLFTVGKFGIGLYLSKSTLASPYGAAGSLVVLLAFIYYSAQIFFIGAEFTQVYANHYGSKIKPSEHGRAIPHEEPSEIDQPSEPGKDERQGVFGSRIRRGTGRDKDREIDETDLKMAIRPRVQKGHCGSFPF